MHSNDTTHNTDPLAEHFATVPRHVDVLLPGLCRRRVDTVKPDADETAAAALILIVGALYFVLVVVNLGRYVAGLV